jgi:solute carrier family 39 (zinc transporter), member 1/2/3
MLLQGFFRIGVLFSSTIAQTTYTGCHLDGSISYCFGSNGKETAVATLADSVSTLVTYTSVSAPITSAAQTTVITDCHLHETNIFCIDGYGDDVSVSMTGTVPSPVPSSFNDCHSHGEESFCVDAQGNDVLVLSTTEAGDEHNHADEEGHTDKSSEGQLDCHFHAGVEHCVPAGGSESSSSDAVAEPAASCETPPTRNYNIGLRVGSLFIIFVTSGLAVYLPIFLHKLPLGRINGTIFVMIKQFGTGIIISTAFVHLYTHAYLMFTNRCLTGIEYEATTSAVVMAGLLVAFLVEYSSYRFIQAKGLKKCPRHTTTAEEVTMTGAKGTGDPANGQSVDGNSALHNISHSHGLADFDQNTILAVGVMEAGILFHSVLIGLTLVVAPDSSANTSGYYKTLLAVIVFHQFFEGLALGARIALLKNSALHFGIWSKVLMASAFALITPLGMAIGIGVLNEFNGNDRGTIITIAVLDALSAGLLLWVGIVDMWARDWAVGGGEMMQAGGLKTIIGLFSLIVGMALMSVLGKWA